MERAAMPCILTVDMLTFDEKSGFGFWRFVLYWSGLAARNECGIPKEGVCK